MKDIWKRVSSIGLVVVLMATLLMSFPLVSAKPPGACEPWPECKDGEEPPADPAIAFFYGSTARTPDRLMVMNADGSNQAVIFEGYFRCNGISWSPDAKSLAWSGFKYVPNVPGYDHGVWRIDVNVVDGMPQGSNLQRLVTSEDYIGQAAWSPLGNEIAYKVIMYDGTNIRRIDAVLATGGIPYTIYTPPDGFGITSGSSVTWSSDGTQLAAVGLEIGAGIEGKSIIIIDRATGTVTHTLLTGQFDPRGLSWARQGVDTLLFEYGMIYTVDIETETVEPVVTGYFPCWSPDNSKIVYMQPLNGRKVKISIYEFSTGDITPIGGGARPDWRRF